MNSKLLIAFFSRTSVALLNFLIVLLTARFMGAETRGIIAIIMLGITFTQVLQQIIGGAIIYFAKKTSIQNLLIPSYIWAVAAALIVTSILVYTEMLSRSFFLHVFTLSIIQSLIATHLTLLLSFEKIKAQNILMLLQIGLIACYLSVSLLYFNSKAVIDYIIALYIGYIFSLIISAFFLARLKIAHSNEYQLSITLIKSILKYGSVIQLTNIVQLLNYRLSYFVLKIFGGDAAVGVLSTAVAFGESAWLFSKSLTNIQYPKIVHSHDRNFQIKLTVAYAKAAFIGTLILLIPLLLMPTSFYISVLGKEFDFLKNAIYLLAPGILLIGFTTIYTHYFSGILLNRINLIASAIGLLLTIIAGYFLIPKLGLAGACLSTSLSHCVTGIFLIVVFIKTTQLNLIQLLPNKFSFKQLIDNLR